MTTPDVIDLRAPQWDADAPCDLAWVLTAAGPSFTDTPSNADIFDRLDLFGRMIHSVESFSQREVARQTWIDWLDQNTSISQPARVVQRAVDAGKRNQKMDTRVRWYIDTELAEIPPTVDLVGGHLPAEGVVLFYGPSGHGKTHLLLDLAQSVATGQPWHGNMVKQGPVAYVIAEGIGGLARRVDAWKYFHEWPDATGVRFRPSPVHLLEPTDAAAFLADLRTWDPPPVLIVLDTLAWCMAPGDENSTKDMSAFVAVIGELRSTLHATVALAHHSGRDTSRERGNTARAAACDTVVQVKEEDGRIVVTCTKQREAPPFEPIRFRLVACNGSVIPQRAIEAGEGDHATDKERLALEVLQNISVSGEGSPTSRWDQSCRMAHGTFYRARKRLIELGLVRVDKRRNFPTDSPIQSQGPNEVPF